MMLSPDINLMLKKAELRARAETVIEHIEEVAFHIAEDVIFTEAQEIHYTKAKALLEQIEKLEQE